MKRIAFPLVLIFSLFITSFSCSNTPKRSRKPVSTITIQPKKATYVLGDKVAVNVQTKLKNGEIENIKVYYKNQLLKESKDLNFTVEGIDINTLGNSNFKVEAIKTDGINNTRTQTIKSVSDSETKIYNYQVVNHYPHSKKHYTQGLEYYKGFFYEGTGEYGTSGLYKVNVNSGKTLQSSELDDKYFGEGITVLNDKIYQLTYRSGTGFVYQLEDFALIDSFQIHSSTKEGWGLTNDGTNLIMSDGSHILTWIDPNDFSVIKTLQVANNKDIIYYLNELEYIDGIIYANIYTTEIIVQIDENTGKILAEINCKGIVDMYKNNNDTINYMNGIAYDSANGRLFVTGKLWPKLFEIKLVPLE